MPMSITETAGGTPYVSPFVGKPSGIIHVKVDVSDLTTDTGSGGEVDANGYLKPGVPFTVTGELIGATNTLRVGVTVEAVKIVAAGATLSGITADPLVAIATICVLNRDLVEDNLGRALTANEIAGLNGVASSITLTTT